MTSFGNARNLTLAAPDYEKFVDPSIGGQDRNIALKLLKMMPPGKRGDFVYVRKDGTLLSNRPELLPLVTHVPDKQKLVDPPNNFAASRNTVRPMTYPVSTGNGGGWIRYYSQPGVNALMGYAIVPCDGYFPNSGESGNMYFNSYSATSTGSVDDAGLTVNSTSVGIPSGYTQAQTAAAFVNAGSYGGWNPGQWINQTQRWPCGMPLGVMYGTLPPNGGIALSFLAIGIPDFDPTQVNMPPSSSNWSSSAWTFFDTPSPLMPAGGSGSWNGIPSNCMSCYVATMFTVAQNGQTGFNLDGACFGQCGSDTETGMWYDIVGGELTMPCQNTSSTTATCTITYQSSGTWMGGENDSVWGTNFYRFSDQQLAEGINLSSGANQTARSENVANRFATNLPAAPASPCSPDADRYCAVVVVAPLCTTKEIGAGVDREPETISRPGTYEIFRKNATNPILELQGTFSAVKDDSSGRCSSTLIWSPSNPSNTYNDPSLP